MKQLIATIFAIVTFVSAQSAEANNVFRFSDHFNSYQGGYFIDGIPSTAFIDTGENRFQKSGRVISETIGGFKGIGGEVVDIALLPLREPVLFLGATATVGFLMANDYELTKFWQTHVETSFDWFNPPRLISKDQTFFPALNNLGSGDLYMLSGIGLSYAYGFAFNDERAQVAALLSSKAIVYSYLTTQVVLKPLFGRIRPVANLADYSGPNAGIYEPGGYATNPYLFRRANGVHFLPNGVGTAFPSFHYTQYFAVARVYSGVYDNSWVPYVAAVALSATNIKAHRHWVSDIAAGALLGTAIGQITLNGYRERHGVHLQAIPSMSSKGAGISFHMTF